MRRPRIAFLMDQNTSAGGARYEAAKGYFHRFAMGLRWRHELSGTDHPGQAIFAGFVDACAVNA